MRRIALFLVTTAAMVVLLFSYRTSRGPSAVADPGAAGDVGIVVSGHVPGGAPAGNSGSTSGSGGTSATGGSSSSGSNSLVANGSVAQTRWGPVQVQVVITGGRITDVKTLQYPHGNSRDQQINAYALPQLRSRVLAAQTADIDAVSGATVTSDGYVRSLQAALDAAHYRK